LRENIPATIRVFTELEDKRGEQAAEVALQDILEVKVVVRYQD
jgi:hypothetical protein